MKNLFRWLKSRRFEIIVFFTGAAVLIVEITATRILSPYYGNTIYAVSSIIGVILGALSFGYWRGGLSADTKPEEQEFFKIIFQAGISLCVLFALVVAVLPVGSAWFSLMTGPLVWSLLLFFVPSYLMGKCSPFAIVLAHKAQPRKGLGQVTGSIFFWSTLGSITGSLASGFILIPYIGIKAILCVTASFILFLGAIGYALHRPPREQNNIAAVVIIILMPLLGVFMQLQPPPEYILVKDGVYQQLKVVDVPEHPLRLFFQDSNLSSGMFTNDDRNMVFNYTKYYHLHDLAKKVPAQALFMGAGAYTIPKALHNTSPTTQIDVVDIEPSLEQIGHTYFKLPETPKIRTYTADGRRFLRDSTKTYDLIFSDVYSSLLSIPAHFTTKEFFALAKSKLAPGGIFMANIVGDLTRDDVSFLFSEIRTMREVFPNMAVIATESTASSEPQNFIFFALKDDSPLTLSRLQHALPAGPPFQDLPLLLLNLDSLPLERHTLLTDDFAPVERLTAKFVHYQL
jgi:spermidine synthase